MEDIDRLSRRVPVLCKVAPAIANVHMEDVHRAGGIMGILGELDRAGLLDTSVPTVHAETMGDGARPLGRAADQQPRGARLLPRRARRRADAGRLQPGRAATTASTPTAPRGVIRDAEHAFSKDGGLAVLYGNLALDGCIVKTAGVDESILVFSGPAVVFESQDDAVERHPQRQGQGRRRGRHPLRGPARRPRHAGDALSDELPEIEGPRQGLRAHHRRALLGRHLGPLHRPRLAGSGRGRHHRPRAGRRPDRDRHPEPQHPPRGGRCRAASAAAPSSRPRAGSRPHPRKRKVSAALKAYAMLATSAAKGAVRQI